MAGDRRFLSCGLAAVNIMLFAVPQHEAAFTDYLTDETVSFQTAISTIVLDVAVGNDGTGSLSIIIL